MTIVFEDDHEDIFHQWLNKKQTNTRQDIWLWLLLHTHYIRDGLPLNTCNGSSMKDVINQQLEYFPHIIKNIQSFVDQNLIPDESLNWIIDDERQYRWLLSKIEEFTERKFPRGLVHLVGRPHIIAMLDIWNVRIEWKAQQVADLYISWRKHIAKDSQFSWFTDKKESAKRCMCAWDWIEKQYSGQYLTPFSRTIPISNYQDLLIFFDRANFRSHEQKVIIQGIKNLWSRRQFDERNSNKRQINVMISHVAINLLDELGEMHEMKRAQVIEKLIRMETENNLYLTDPAKRDALK